MPPRASTSSASAPGKRRRISEKQPEFGAPSDADLPSARAPSTSSSVYSTRTLPSDRILPLTTMCARIFGNNMLKLSVNEESWATTREWLNLLPDTMIPKILAILSATCPTRLSHGLLIAHFLRGPTITLTDELTGVEKFTIIAIGKAGTDLLELELSGFEKFPDSLFASILPKLPSLRKLVLRGCSKVGPQTVEAAAKSCPHLTTVNFNSTSVTPLSLLPLLVACHSLESLKLAGISNWTDATFAKLSSGLDAHENFRLEKLHTLKLRQTMLTDMSLNYLLGLCPNLRRLDLSFTPVRRPRHRMADTIPPLEKLSLTSTRVSGADLLTIVAHLPQLKTLAIGALGGGQGSTATISNSSAMTMTDDILIALTDILVKYESLENINLVGNSKLGVSGRKTALIEFVRRVGRRCKVCLPHVHL
ncbi:hypothetical protein JAAARDRAFT_29865 [Jaapia argillacea MUCL 33604]|uniref:F-box domain-containing protein n=1 Tax=Jaapia argillacea MUCL 33604 TaxID=933084 RepID=A0A067Q9T7_9AGAM|nr:hypothetical protein JAAARDRAFT_29865 [Jaapia argillacea MUCL 33604]